MTDRLTFPATPLSVRAARVAVSGACRRAGLPYDVCDTMVLLTSETVTNAVLYGRSEVRLTVNASPKRIRVEVGDDNCRGPQRRAYNPNALDGRGMNLVDALASAWGVDAVENGKIVWFELRV
jgi:anti-sigma regulatory factor (Ser/Thr protein kinase)